MAAKIRGTFILVLLVIGMSAHVESISVMRLCGYKLVYILKTLCKGDTFAKTAAGGIERNLRESIYESCCLKQCTYSHLKTYCNADIGLETISTTTTSNELPLEDPAASIGIEGGSRWSFIGPLNFGVQNEQQKHHDRQIKDPTSNLARLLQNDPPQEADDQGSGENEIGEGQ